MTRGHPQTKQSRKTARRKSRQLQRMVADMLAASRLITNPVIEANLAAFKASETSAFLASLNLDSPRSPLRVEAFDRASVMAVLGVPSTIRRI